MRRLRFRKLRQSKSEVFARALPVRDDAPELTGRWKDAETCGHEPGLAVGDHLAGAGPALGLLPVRCEREPGHDGRHAWTLAWDDIPGPGVSSVCGECRDGRHDQCGRSEQDCDFPDDCACACSPRGHTPAAPAGPDAGTGTVS